MVHHKEAYLYHGYQAVIFMHKPHASEGL